MAIENLTASILTASPYYEGDTITLQVAWTNTTSLAHTVTIIWGDGTSSVATYPANTSYTENFNHTYEQNDLYGIIISVYDGVDSPSTVNANLIVENIPPSITSVAAQLDNDTGFVELDYSFTDPGVKDTWTVTINWGDGSSTTSSRSPGSYSIPHIYSSFPPNSDSHRRLITLTIRDNDGGLDSDSLYPIMTFKDEVVDAAEADLECYGVILYDDDVDGNASGLFVVDGFSFYQFDGDDDGEGFFNVNADVDYTSVLVIDQTVVCLDRGATPFERFIMSPELEPQIARAESESEDSFSAIQ